MKAVVILGLLSGTALSRTVSSCSCLFSFSARPNVETWTLTGTSSCDRYRVEPTCVSWELPSSTSTPIPVDVSETPSPKLRKPDLKRAEAHAKRATSTTAKGPSPAPATSKTSAPASSTTSKQATTTPAPAPPSSPTTASTTSKTSTSTSSACTPSPTKSSGKRGVLYNSTPLTNLFSQSCGTSRSKVNWAANWYSADATDGNPNSYNQALMFIPMLWSGAPDLTSIWSKNANAAINAGADSLLSFNEPDGCGGGGSCMSMDDAISNYTTYMNPFQSRAKLGSPSITNSLNSGQGLDWLATFFKRCPQCHVDFVPIHWYGDASQVTDFQNYVAQAASQANGRPIWLTEFACSSGSEAAIENFLKVNLAWLDSQSYVQRYGYFMAGGQGQLVTASNTLSTQGQIYNTY